MEALALEEEAAEPEEAGAAVAGGDVATMELVQAPLIVVSVSRSYL